MVQGSKQNAILAENENGNIPSNQILAYGVKKVLDHPFVVNAFSAKDLAILKEAYKTLEDEVEKSDDVIWQEIQTPEEFTDYERLRAEQNYGKSLEKIYLMFANAYFEKGGFYTAEPTKEAN